VKEGGFHPARSRFLLSAPRWQDAPRIGLPEIAIAGRSNVGKSTLINFMLGRRHLARTSSTPGRTQLLNFFCVDDRLVLVDLPGYGYAKAPRSEVDRWNAAMRSYIGNSPSLRGVLLLLDVRREPSAEDRAFCSLVCSAGVPLLGVVTKADKVARGQRLSRLRAISARLAEAGGSPQFVLTSARSGEGRQELWRRILEMADEKQQEGADGAPVVVAVDGPSGAGKSTTARALAARLGWNYVDTGAMYRSIGLKADRLGISLDDDPALAGLVERTELALRRAEDGSLCILLDGEDVSGAIREHRVSSLASRVSARRPVRDAMARYQRELGSSAPSVLEGRDIGTVVFPDALLKVYLTASAEERARRRSEELRSRGQEVSTSDVLRDLERRDQDDSSRECAPLQAAADAVEVDTTGLSPEEVVERLAVLVAERLAAREVER
jgi:CMP/dCMP kinase